jgi:ribonuclease J
MTLRYFPVDHSVFGATAFALETSAGWVAHTRDLRLHGGRGENTWRFADKTRSLHPQVLICKGTRAGEEKCVTETEVYENALEAVSAAHGLVIADFAPRNLERLLSFGRLAAETKRRLVILARDAYLLDKMALASPEVPHLEEWAHVPLYTELKARVDTWERQVHHKYGSKLLTSADIAASPLHFIVCLSFCDVKELIDIAPKGGLYLYSSSEVFDEEGALDTKRLHNWIKHFEMTPLGLPQLHKEGWHIPDAEQGFHASGHASGPEILEIIQHIKPKMLIPIHTENPEYFVEHLARSGIQVVLPEYGEAITLV